MYPKGHFIDACGCGPSHRCSSVLLSGTLVCRTHVFNLSQVCSSTTPIARLCFTLDKHLAPLTPSLQLGMVPAEPEGQSICICAVNESLG